MGKSVEIRAHSKVIEIERLRGQVWDQARFESAQSQAPLIVIMHGFNNPVNVGAILRAAKTASAPSAYASAL